MRALHSNSLKSPTEGSLKKTSPLDPRVGPEILNRRKSPDLGSVTPYFSSQRSVQWDDLQTRSCDSFIYNTSSRENHGHKQVRIYNSVTPYFNEQECQRAVCL